MPTWTVLLYQIHIVIVMGHSAVCVETITILCVSGVFVRAFFERDPRNRDVRANSLEKISPLDQFNVIKGRKKAKEK